MAHELGHNFGTHHARVADLHRKRSARLALPSLLELLSWASTAIRSSVRASPAPALEHTGFARGNYGWLSAGQHAHSDEQQATTLLIPLEANDSGSREVDRRRSGRRAPSSPSSFDRSGPLAVRQALSATSPIANGVSIRITPSYKPRSRRRS